MWVDRIRKGKREQGGSGHVLLLQGSPDSRRDPQEAVGERRTQAPRAEEAPGEEGSRVGKGLEKGASKNSMITGPGPRSGVSVVRSKGRRSAMDVRKLEETARELVAPGKGILAADESFGTIGKRFEAVGIES